MNRRLVILLGLAGQFLLLAGIVSAQPALQRIEDQLRKQRTVRAGDPPTDDQQTAGNSPGYLGVLADDRQENGKGVRVTDAVPGGPAAKGGLKVDDLITAIDGQPITTADDMVSALQGRPVGAVVKFHVERGGEGRDLDVRLERRPAPGVAPGAPPENGPPPGDSLILNTRRPKLGVRTVSLSPFIREQIRLPGSFVAGVYVTYVDPDSPAGKAGLPAKSVITSVDGEPMDSPDTLAALVHRAGPGQALNVNYYFEDHPSVIVITLAGGPSQPAAPAASGPVRGKPRGAMDQPPGFAPDVPGDDSAATIEDLQRRIARLEERVAELEAATVKPGATDTDK